MATINLTIDVDSSTFEKLCERELQNIPSETIQDILVASLRQCLVLDKEQFENKAKSSFCSDSSLFVFKSDGWNAKKQPTELLSKIINSINFKEEMKELTATAFEHIKTNYESIIKDSIYRAFSEMLFSNEKKWEIQNMIHSALSSK